MGNENSFSGNNQSCMDMVKAKLTGNKVADLSASNISKSMVAEEIDMNALDLNAAVDYAINGNKKESNYVKMELLVSCEGLPKFSGLRPNVMAIIYLDNNTLDIKKKF